MGFSLEFCVRFISLLPLEGFSSILGEMFISVRQCAEPIAQPRILSYRSFRFSLDFVSFTCTSGMISNEHWPNVDLSETVCRTYESAMQTQGHGQS